MFAVVRQLLSQSLLALFHPTAQRHCAQRHVPKRQSQVTDQPRHHQHRSVRSVRVVAPFRHPLVVRSARVVVPFRHPPVRAVPCPARLAVPAPQVAHVRVDQAVLVPVVHVPALQEPVPASPHVPAHLLQVAHPVVLQTDQVLQTVVLVDLAVHSERRRAGAVAMSKSSSQVR